MKNEEIIDKCRYCEKDVLRHKPFTLDCFYPMSFYHIKCFKKLLIKNKVLKGIAKTDTLE